MDALDLLVSTLAYLFGCFLGMALGFGLWAKGQPAGATFKDWRRARLPSNVISLAIAGIGAGVWLDGTLVAWLQLGEWAAVTPAISCVAGAAIVFSARRIVSWANRKAAEKTGTDAGDDS